MLDVFILYDKITYKVACIQQIFSVIFLVVHEESFYCSLGRVIARDSGGYGRSSGSLYEWMLGVCYSLSLKALIGGGMCGILDSMISLLLSLCGIIACIR